MTILKAKSKMPVAQQTAINNLLRAWPVLVFCGSILFSLGGIYYKLENISSIVQKSESRFDVINDRQTLSSQTIIELRGKVDLTTQMANQTAKEVAAINERVVSIERNTRFAPR